MSNRNEVYAAIDSERSYQEELWPKPAHAHELESYVLYMDNYLHKLKAILSTTDQSDTHNRVESLNFLRKVTALGVAAMEEHGAPHRYPKGGPF